MYNSTAVLDACTHVTCLLALLHDLVKGSVLKDQIPLGRMGDVEEVANLALSMTSDFSSWLNGAVIQLDGGKLPFTAGDFNGLVKVDEEQWNIMEQIIRSSNNKSKL